MVSADTMDAEMHRDRLAGRRAKRTHDADADTLPDGAFIALDAGAWLVRGESILEWSAAGYVGRRARPRGSVSVLTPRALVTTIAAGYRPAVHPSAERP